MEQAAFERLFASMTAAVREKLEPASGCHDFDHTLRVMANAAVLCDRIPQADRHLVLLAALLHDYARPEEMAQKGGVCHAELGARQIQPLLERAGCKISDIARISEAVRTHRYRSGNRPQTLEAMIVYDADKLDSLGAVGLGRAFLFAGREHARLHNRAEEALNSPAYSREDTALREYLVKLRKLPDAMLTAPGREIALERAAYMKEFFIRLDRETNLESTWLPR